MSPAISPVAPSPTLPLSSRRPSVSFGGFGVRTHWGIVNSVHWVLDVAFGEDASRVRQGNAAENLSVLRRMALNMLKVETTSQGGVAAKRKRAGWDEDYLLLVLAQ